MVFDRGYFVPRSAADLDIQMDDVEIHLAAGLCTSGFVYLCITHDSVFSVLRFHLCLAGVGLARDCFSVGVGNGRAS